MVLCFIYVKKVIGSNPISPKISKTNNLIDRVNVDLICSDDKIHCHNTNCNLLF